MIPERPQIYVGSCLGHAGISSATFKGKSSRKGAFSMLSGSRDLPCGLPGAPGRYCPDHLQLGTAGLCIAGKMSVELFSQGNGVY